MVYSHRYTFEVACFAVNRCSASVFVCKAAFLEKESVDNRNV